jgi:MoxR-like ATPase
VLLVGPPGIGKTYFANAVAQTLGLQDALFIQMAGETNGSSLGGSSTFWHNSSPGKLFELLAWGDGRNAASANPVVVLDEVDKVHENQHNPLGALYSLLEEETSKKFQDQSLTDVLIDCSHVRFYCSANNLDLIPEPLLNRMMVFNIDLPSPEQLRDVIQNIYRGIIKRLRTRMHHELPAEVIEAALLLNPRAAKIRIECAVAMVISKGRTQMVLSDWPDVPMASQPKARRGIGFTI